MEQFELFDNSPTIEELPHQPLSARGLCGPTVAHKIEELHTPCNIAFTTFSTGSSALQNVIGVTYQELNARIEASINALDIIGLREGDNLLVTYPPLVNVFPVEALQRRGIHLLYLNRSSRMSLIESMLNVQPSAILGEGAFIYASMRDAEKLGFPNLFNRTTRIITAGTPLNLDMHEAAQERRMEVHDLYGCQEFGWIACDGIPLRNDLSFMPAEKEWHEVIVGGLPTGDCLILSNSGHMCNRKGRLITYRLKRSVNDIDIVIRASKFKSEETVRRIAKSILRLKGKHVYVSPSVRLGADCTVLELKGSQYNKNTIPSFCIDNAIKTELFDSLAEAQCLYQNDHRHNEVWSK